MYNIHKIAQAFTQAIRSVKKVINRERDKEMHGKWWHHFWGLRKDFKVTELGVARKDGKLLTLPTPATPNP